MVLRHPSLRYGGYHILALISFVPRLYLTNIDLNYKYFIKKSLILIVITLVIFISRNLLRLEKEFNQYSYNPLENNNYQFIGGDKNFI